MNKIIRKLNLQIDIERATEYYFELEKNYQHLKWEAPIGNVIIHAWSIHGIKGRPYPVPFFVPESEPAGIENYYETELVFGWARDIIEMFPYGYQAGIGSNPPGTIINAHSDPTSPHMVRLHIPIITNINYTWTTSEGTVHLEAGSAYIVDTSYEHATVNAGSTPRVHFGMCIPRDKICQIEEILPLVEC